MTKIFVPKTVPKTKDFELDVPHFIQRDNTGGQGYRECNMTSHAMVVEYLLDGYLSAKAKEKGYREPEDAYAVLMDGDTTDHAVHTRALRKLGIESYFSYNTDLNELAHTLKQGIPVVMGCDYKGSGHMVVAYGLAEGGVKVLCPFGIRAGSQDWWHRKFSSPTEAKPDFFSWELMKKIFTVNSHDDGWARIITSVKGVPTALDPTVLGKTI